MHVIIVLCRILLRISRRGLECDIGFVRHSCVIKLDRFFFANRTMLFNCSFVDNIHTYRPFCCFVLFITYSTQVRASDVCGQYSCINQ